MRLQYVASACVLVEHAGVRVLCDPWLTDGIYGGAWYHNPPLTVTPEDFADIDYLYISHCHPDHLDWATLDRLPRVPVIIGRYVEDFMGKQLRAKDFFVCEVSHEQDVQLGNGLTLQVIPADDCDPRVCGQWIGCPVRESTEKVSYQLDTLAVFRAGGQVIVNANDCPFELAQAALRRVQQSPDLLCVGYAGAGPWPQCFSNLSEDEKRLEALKKKASFLGQMRNYVNHLQPKSFLPFAGQYTLGGSLVDLNHLRGVPELDELPDDPRMVRLNRNAWYDCETGQASEPWRPTDRAALLAYRETLRSKALDHEGDPWPVVSDVEALLLTARTKWRERCAARDYVPTSTLTIVPRYLFGAAYHVDWRSNAIVVDARLLKRLLMRHCHWNNMEIASQLTFQRPGEYDRGLMHHLSYFHV